MNGKNCKRNKEGGPLKGCLPHPRMTAQVGQPSAQTAQRHLEGASEIERAKQNRCNLCIVQRPEITDT